MSNIENLPSEDEEEYDDFGDIEILPSEDEEEYDTLENLTDAELREDLDEEPFEEYFEEYFDPEPINRIIKSILETRDEYPISEDDELFFVEEVDGKKLTLVKSVFDKFNIPQVLNEIVEIVDDRCGNDENDILCIKNPNLETAKMIIYLMDRFSTNVYNAIIIYNLLQRIILNNCMPYTHKTSKHQRQQYSIGIVDFNRVKNDTLYEFMSSFNLDPYNEGAISAIVDFANQYGLVGYPESTKYAYIGLFLEDLVCRGYKRIMSS